jgi:hypothetical protein
MIRFIVAMILAIMSIQAQANEIWYFCLFSSAANAEADAGVGTFWDSANSAWDFTVSGCQVNGGKPLTKVVSSQSLLNGISLATGTALLIGCNGANATLAAETTAGSACYLAIDQTALELNLAGGSYASAVQVGSTFTQSGYQSLNLSPVAMGYPAGAPGSALTTSGSQAPQGQAAH